MNQYSSPPRRLSPYRPKCGHRLRAEAKFCAGCGLSLAAPPPSQQPPPPYTPAPAVPPYSPPPQKAQASNQKRGLSSWILWEQYNAPIVPQQGSSGLGTMPPSTQSGGDGASWLWTLFYLGLIVGGIAGAIYIFPFVWEFVQVAFGVVVYVLFFPLLFSLGMIVVGGITNMFIPGATGWMVHFGLWLLTQRWWWFPIGQIAGVLTLLFM